MNLKIFFEKKLKDPNLSISYTKSSAYNFFKILKEFQPLKYKKALKEFYKAVNI